MSRALVKWETDKKEQLYYIKMICIKNNFAPKQA